LRVDVIGSCLLNRASWKREFSSGAEAQTFLAVNVGDEAATP
jgi:hypothetical protein